MRKKIVFTSLALGSTVAISVSLPAKAANLDLSQYDYTQLKNISARPLQSDNQLLLTGDPSQNQGFTAFFNLDFSAPDVGHIEISKNAPGNIAPYYTTGKHASPELPPSGATRSASLTDILGFANFSTFLNSNNLSLDKIGISYGQKTDRDLTETWNLGTDLLGQNWFASPDSTVEERIYSAKPEDVEIFLIYEATKFIDFGYSDFYNVLEYGSTTAIEDDFDAIFSDPFSASQEDDLSPLLSGLASSFLRDVENAGGGIQAVYEEGQVQDPIFSVGNGYGVVSFPFPVSLRAVPLEAEKVPEPSSILGLALLYVWTVTSYRGKAWPS